MKISKLASATMPIIAALALSACNDSSSDNSDVESGKSATIQYYDVAASTQKSTSDYANFSLHIWNNAECDMAADRVIGDNLGGWDAVSFTPTSVDENGPIWEIPLNSNNTNCLNFIARQQLDGSQSKLHSDDLKFNYTQYEDSAGYITLGKDDIFATLQDAIDSVTGVAGASAHWVDSETLLWSGGDSSDDIRLYYIDQGFNHEELDKASYLSLKSGSISEEVQAKFRHLTGLTAYHIDFDGITAKDLIRKELVVVAMKSDETVLAGTQVQFAGALDDLYAAKAKTLAFGAVIDGNTTFTLWAPTAQSVSLVLFDDSKTQTSKVAMTFDVDTGAWVSSSASAPHGTFYRYEIEVYHPQSRKIHTYQVTDPYSLSLAMNSELSQVVDMTHSDITPSGWDSLQRPHNQVDLAQMVIYESHVRDFSAMDSSVENKGKYLAFTEDGSVPVEHLKSLAESGVTHLHLQPVFDIATINEDPEQTIDINDAGSYAKLCMINSALQQHESFGQRCSEDALTVAQALADLLPSDSPENPVVQALNSYVRPHDRFNWGYDPFHYTVPEGSYATDADGMQRIYEFREMVMSVKNDIGMNIVVDLVYNHTNASGPNADTSVLDKVVPWYYHRLNDITGAVENSTCCDNTAPEHEMFGKMIDDSLVVWSEQYKIDAYRWDLMGHHPLAQIESSLAAVREVFPETYFYGEGWNFGEVENDTRFTQATQANLAGTGIGSFSDRLRDAVRGGSPFDEAEGIRVTQGFGNGAYVQPNELATADQAEWDRAQHQTDLIRVGMAGNIKSFVLIDKDDEILTGYDVDYNGQHAGYADQPWEVQNYVSKHDNQTLWDNILYKAEYGLTADELERMQAVSLSTVTFGQGMPFLHMGVELLRSKSMQRDSYDSGDWYNLVDFNLTDNNWDKGLPRADKDEVNFALIQDVIDNNTTGADATNMSSMLAMYKEMISIRSDMPLMRLPNADEINARVDFRNTGSEQTPGLIVMTIDNGVVAGADLDDRFDAVVVIINASPESQTADDFVDGTGAPIALSNFELHANHINNGISHGSTFADATTNDTTNGQFEVPAWSSAVFVQSRVNATRGAGVPVGKKGDLAVLPPFGSTDIYIKGDLNGWGALEEFKMTYVDNGIYRLDTLLTAADKSQGFKFADADWTDGTNFGCEQVKAEGSLAIGDEENCAYQFEDKSYRFELNALDKDNITVGLFEL